MKTFTVVGTSRNDWGRTKIRFSNDVMRVKTLIKKGHTDVHFWPLPYAMSKPEAVGWLRVNDMPIDPELLIRAEKKYPLPKKVEPARQEHLVAA